MDSAIGLNYNLFSDFDTNKTDVENFTAGLDFVNKMQSITYRWDMRTDYLDDDNTDILSIVPDGTHKKPKQDVGFLSQEIEVLEKEIGFSTSTLNQLFCDGTSETSLGLKSAKFIPVLVNAIQELSTKNNTLAARITTLENA